MRDDVHFLAEREKLRNNMMALRSTAARMSLLSRELETLHKECDFTRADVRSLKAHLNQVALELGVQPLP